MCALWASTKSFRMKYLGSWILFKVLWPAPAACQWWKLPSPATWTSPPLGLVSVWIIVFNVNTYSSKECPVICPPEQDRHFIWRSLAALVEEGLSQVGALQASGSSEPQSVAWLASSRMWAASMALLTLLLIIVLSVLYHWTVDVNPHQKGSLMGLPCRYWWVSSYFTPHEAPENLPH